MKQATITTQQVYASPDGRGVEIVARIEGGDVAPGMLLRVPLNRTTEVTWPIRQITRLSPLYLHLILECDDEEEANLILMLNFEQETLRVTEDDAE